MVKQIDYHNQDSTEIWADKSPTCTLNSILIIFRFGTLGLYLPDDRSQRLILNWVTLYQLSVNSSIVCPVKHNLYLQLYGL